MKFLTMWCGVVLALSLIGATGCSMESAQVIREDLDRLESEIKRLQGERVKLSTLDREIAAMRELVSQALLEQKLLLEKHPEVKKIIQQAEAETQEKPPTDSAPRSQGSSGDDEFPDDIILPDEDFTTSP
jgi:archaellum component FlaC